MNGRKVGEKEDGSDLQLEVTRAQKKQERQKVLSQQFAKMKIERISKYQGLNLYVKNLEDSIDDAKLNQHFNDLAQSPLHELCEPKVEKAADLALYATVMQLKQRKRLPK